MNPKRAKKYHRKLWGGFVDDKLHFFAIDRGFGGWGVEFSKSPYIFMTRREARQQYQDVRAVEIREI